MIQAYLDNCIVSGKVRADLRPEEMAAVLALAKADDEGQLELVTSPESHREQGRTQDPLVHAKLVQSRGDVPIVADDHKVIGFHNQMDRLGTVAVGPFVTEYVDEGLFKNFTKAGLKGADARHLMYAVHNRCAWFVTTDPHFIDRRAQLEPLCRGLKIVTPIELTAELK
jgi:hypothetical protein